MNKINSEILNILKKEFIGYDERISNWIFTVVKNEYKRYYNSFRERNQILKESDQNIFFSETKHIIDYLNSSYAPLRINRLSYSDAKRLTKNWVDMLNKKSSTHEDASDIEVIKILSDGYKIVKLKTKQAYKREGRLMEHCVADYYGERQEIFSIRDSNNIPVCTIEIDEKSEIFYKKENGYIINQIKGFDNENVPEKHLKYCHEGLNELIQVYNIKNQDIAELHYINGIVTNKGILLSKKNTFLNYKEEIEIDGDIILEAEEISITSNLKFVNPNSRKTIKIKGKRVVIESGLANDEVKIFFDIEAEEVVFHEIKENYTIRLIKNKKFISQNNSISLYEFIVSHSHLDTLSDIHSKRMSICNCRINKLSNLKIENALISNSIIKENNNLSISILKISNSEIDCDFKNNKLEDVELDRYCSEYKKLKTRIIITSFFKHILDKLDKFGNFFSKNIIYFGNNNIINSNKFNFFGSKSGIGKSRVVSEIMSYMLRRKPETLLYFENSKAEIKNLPILYKEKSFGNNVKESFFNKIRQYKYILSHHLKKTLEKFELEDKKIFPQIYQTSDTLTFIKNGTQIKTKFSINNIEFCSLKEIERKKININRKPSFLMIDEYSRYSNDGFSRNASAIRSNRFYRN